ncbi:MAG: aminoglycoside phosphotransferase family protein [Gammaproteobacteria bacterium]
MDERRRQLHAWLLERCGAAHMTPASDDASFRRYFRVRTREGTFIAVDAPPGKEDCRPFATVTQMLEAVGLNVPHVYAYDFDAGFLLLGDLGADLYLHRLDDTSAARLYGDALAALLKIQTVDAGTLPRYDNAMLMREMELFRQWYLSEHSGLRLGEERDATLTGVFENLARAALAQPQVFVHLDYHSRNLMVTHENNPGILDYQDAVRGPVTYDLVSLLRDCYIAWPRSQVIDWTLSYRDRLTAHGIVDTVDDATFLQWFDLMGVQRHLKAAGIFARLNHRDGKSGFLKDIPRTLNYIREVAPRYSQTSALPELLSELGVT